VRSSLWLAGLEARPWHAWLAVRITNTSPISPTTCTKYTSSHVTTLIHPRRESAFRRYRIWEPWRSGIPLTCSVSYLSAAPGTGLMVVDQRRPHSLLSTAIFQEGNPVNASFGLPWFELSSISTCLHSKPRTLMISIISLSALYDSKTRRYTSSVLSVRDQPLAPPTDLLRTKNSICHNE
jgi:hypothetical protein